MPEDARYRRLAALLGQPMRPTDYVTPDPENPERDVLPPHHIIVEMCRAAGVHGEISLRPHLRLGEAERTAGARPFPGRSRFKAPGSPTRGFRFRPRSGGRPDSRRLPAGSRPTSIVQVGSADDPPLPGAADLRGHPRLRHVAAVIAASELFVGLEGFLTHLARAVDCPSVVVIGGRARPGVYGYACNENLHAPGLLLALRFAQRLSEDDLACMHEIAVQDVVDAVHRLAARKLPRPLPAETFILP